MKLAESFMLNQMLKYLQHNFSRKMIKDVKL